MDLYRALIEDYEMDSSSESSLQSPPHEPSDVEVDDDDDAPPADDDLAAQIDDDDDDGYDSVGETSEPEEIVVDKRCAEPNPPMPQSLLIEGYVKFGDELAPVIRYVPRSPRMEDRYHPCSPKVSHGYDDHDGDHGRRSTLRHRIRNSELARGRGTFNGFAHHLMPRRITGAVMKRRQLYYFVEWIGGTIRKPHLIEADFMTYYSPDLVIKFHQEMMLNPSTYKCL